MKSQSPNLPPGNGDKDDNKYNSDNLTDGNNLKHKFDNPTDDEDDKYIDDKYNSNNSIDDNNLKS